MFVKYYITNSHKLIIKRTTMLKFEVNGKLGNKVLTFPTNLSELTSEYLSNLTDGINIADNYSLIALCHKERLSTFVMAGKGSKNNISTAVVPLFIKSGYVNGESFIKTLHCADKLIITPSDMATGLHVNVPGNNLTMGVFAKYIEGDGFVYQNASKHTEDVYFIEFKIVPNCTIQGVYQKRSATLANPFDIASASVGDI